MPTLIVQDPLWDKLQDAARKRNLSAQTLATAALRDYLQRCADEELLMASQRVARTSHFATSQSEDIVRSHRATKKSSLQ